MMYLPLDELLKDVRRASGAQPVATPAPPSDADAARDASRSRGGR
jgi:hypothetical protein